MGRTTNKLLIILLVTFSSFLCNQATELDNISTISTRHDDDDGRRVLAGYYSLLFSAARLLFKNVVGPSLKKLNGLFKILDRFNTVVQVTQYTIDFGKKINFTQDNAIDYLNCQCDCPNLNATGSCADQTNYDNCNSQGQYCTSFQANPNPLRCLVCDLMPQAPASSPSPQAPASSPSPQAPASSPSLQAPASSPSPRRANANDPSHAPSLSRFVDTFLMGICVTSATIFMHFLV